jgi:hypothetical protein
VEVLPDPVVALPVVALAVARVGAGAGQLLCRLPGPARLG